MLKLIMFSCLISYQFNALAGAEVDNVLENNFLGQGVSYQNGAINLPAGYIAENGGTRSWLESKPGEDFRYFHNELIKKDGVSTVYQTETKDYGNGSYWKDNRMVIYNEQGKIKSVIHCSDYSSNAGDDPVNYKRGSDGCRYYTPKFCKEMVKLNLEDGLSSSELSACNNLLQKMGSTYGKEVENFNKDYTNMGKHFDVVKAGISKSNKDKYGNSLLKFNHKLSGADELLRNSLVEMVSDYEICKDNMALFESDEKASDLKSEPSSVKKD